MRLTQAQHKTFAQMRGYALKARITSTGAILVADSARHNSGVVIEPNGCTQTLSQYLSFLTADLMGQRVENSTSICTR